MPAAESMDMKKMRMTAPTLSQTATASVSSFAENQLQNPISRLNEYKSGLDYQFVGDSGPAHAKIFTVQLIVDGQKFCATGDSKISARHQVAQKALDALGPTIEKELERRKVEKQQKMEAKKTEREERLKQKAEMQESTGGPNDTEGKESVDLKPVVSSESALVGTETAGGNQGATAGNDDDAAKQYRKAIGSLRVLKDIRPGVACVEKVVENGPPGHYEAQVMVDKEVFEGQGESLALAKANAAASALTTLFSIPLVTSNRGFPLYMGDADEYMHLRRLDFLPPSDEHKNAVMVLNELYYESAVYTDLTDNNVSMQQGGSHLISVSVDGITAYGRGVTRKDAKFYAASAAVEQLKCLGILHQRMAEKAAVKAERNASAKSYSSDTTKPMAYRLTMCSAVQDNATAKLNKVHPGLAYHIVDAQSNSSLGNTSFTVMVNVDGQEYMGVGKSKKNARLAAAESVLRSLNMWTKEDDMAKRKAQAAARASRALIEDPTAKFYRAQVPAVSRGYPTQASIRGRTAARGNSMVRARGNSMVRARGNSMVRGRSLLRGGPMRGRGSLSAGQASGFPAAGSAAQMHNVRSFRPRGSGLLNRGTRGARGAGGRGASSVVGASHVEIPSDKNPVMLLNEVYYSAALYQFSHNGIVQTDEATASEHYCMVTVDGITAHGSSTLKKDAKANAAREAVRMLKASGILQQRLVDKSAYMSQKRAAAAATVADQGGFPVRGSATVQRGRVARRGEPGRGRPIQRPGSRVARRGRGSSSVQSWTPQETYTDLYSTEDPSFPSFDNPLYLSFADNKPVQGNAGIQRRAPRRGNRGQMRGRGSVSMQQPFDIYGNSESEGYWTVDSYA